MYGGPKVVDAAQIVVFWGFVLVGLYIGTDIFEEPAATIFSVEGTGCMLTVKLLGLEYEF